MITDANDPAFPENRESHMPDSHCGLTKREYFAAMAVNGFLSLCANDKVKSFEPSMLASDAIKMADALIAELNKEEKK